MRIVYLNPSGRLGGAETSLRELLASIRAAEPGWELWLVLGEDGPLAAIARDLGVRVFVKPFPPALARLEHFLQSAAAPQPFAGSTNPEARPSEFVSSSGIRLLALFCSS